MSAYTLLQDIKTSIGGIGIFKSIEIGLEVGISAKDMDACRIRLKSQEITGVNESRSVEIHLFVDTKNDKDSMHEKAINLIDAIREKLRPIQPTSIVYDNQNDTVFSNATMYYSFDSIVKPQSEDCRLLL